MTFEIFKNKCPVQIHADTLDPIATEQVRLIANHPSLHGFISIMPDAHADAGYVIGFTGKFRQAVIPNIVGVDNGRLLTRVSSFTRTRPRLKNICWSPCRSPTG